MPYRDLGSHHVEQIVQIGAMHYRGKPLPVHLLHARPISAMHVRHVKVIALVAPSFIEDLLELFFRLQIHTKRSVQVSSSRDGRLLVGIHYEQSRWG